MLDQVLELKEREINAATQEERDAVAKEMKALMEQNPDEWAMAMVESARQTADRAEALVKRIKVREQLSEVLPILPLSYIAKNYFNKSRQWLYQRVNGNIVNGKPAEFTDEEIEVFNTAIQDLSRKLGSVGIR